MLFCAHDVFVMADICEQHVAVKFCLLLRKTGTRTNEMLKAAYKDDAMGNIQVFEWFSRFKKGEISIDDQPRSRCSSTSRIVENVEKIREILTDFVTPGQTVNLKFYLEVLKLLRYSLL